MSTEPLGPLFPAAASSSPPMLSEGVLHTFEPLVSSCLQMPQSQCENTSIGEGSVPFLQRESIPYRQKSAAAERLRRHSTDGTGQEQRQGTDARFHPYCRQYSDGGTTNCPTLCPQSFVCFRGTEMPETLTATLTTMDPVEDQSSWLPFSGSPQTSMFMGSQQTYSEVQAVSEEPPSYPSQTLGTYSSLGPLQEFPGVYSPGGQTGSSHYSFQSLLSQTNQDGTMQSLYPKPIYSYSILIFMALRNSKTGSLPVSEIYSFMTEHFPYFKTAPDGWKNSVRHNLSLNKCFEKVENKSGNSSRKGCLWALNPAKVEKMQEELHKWRRKDPLTVRKSMARPEELDRLLGDKPEKFKSLSAHLSLPSSYGQSPLARGTSGVETVPSFTPSQPRELSHCLRRSIYSHVPSLTASQHRHYLPPNPHPFSFYSSAAQQPSSGLPPRAGSLESPLPAQTPPSYSAALQDNHGTGGPASMQELLLEGDLSNDVDTLNPSLTDLQLHGHLWEELRDDSLAPDSLLVIATSPCFPLPSLSQGAQGLRSCGEVSYAGTEGEERGVSDLHLTGLYSTTFTSKDSMAGYLPATGNTVGIPLL